MGVGKVYLVGAGPGAADLITLRGRRAVESADLVICDYLVPSSFLADLGVAMPDENIVRLETGPARKSQDEINQRMLDAAREGKTVVRLKCGDPFVFGRGAEEADFLERHGIPWELVPGLSAFTGATAAASMPLTRREVGRSFAVVTARRAGGDTNTAYTRADSLIIYMGVEALDDIAKQLIQDGWPPDAPAALVERATIPWERRAGGSLKDIAGIAQEQHVAAPAVLIVGQAAAKDGALRARPRILYTGLAPSHFRSLGDLIHWPALVVLPDPEGPDAAREILPQLARKEFDWIIFTSRIGVRSFFHALEEAGLDARTLGGARIITAGAGTDRSLREHGIRADAVPEDVGSRGILGAMPIAADTNVLLVQGTHAPASLQAELTRRGGRVTRLALHRVAPNPELGRPLPEHDVAYFTSPSGVRSCWAAYGSQAFEREIWCMGEITLAEIERLGFNGKVVSPYVPQDQDAAVQAI